MMQEHMGTNRKAWRFGGGGNDKEFPVWQLLIEKELPAKMRKGKRVWMFWEEKKWCEILKGKTH